MKKPQPSTFKRRMTNIASAQLLTVVEESAKNLGLDKEVSDQPRIIPLLRPAQRMRKQSIRRVNDELQSDYKLKIAINPMRLNEDELREIAKQNPATYISRNNIIG